MRPPAGRQHLDAHPPTRPGVSRRQQARDLEPGPKVQEWRWALATRRPSGRPRVAKRRPLGHDAVVAGRRALRGGAVAQWCPADAGSDGLSGGRPSSWRRLDSPRTKQDALEPGPAPPPVESGTSRAPVVALVARVLLDALRRPPPTLPRRPLRRWWRSLPGRVPREPALHSFASPSDLPRRRARSRIARLTMRQTECGGQAPPSPFLSPTPALKSRSCPSGCSRPAGSDRRA